MRSPTTSPLGTLGRTRGVWIALILLALAIRLTVVWKAPDRLMFSDNRFYDSIGWSVASQGSYGMETQYPPAYPTLIAGVYRVFGHRLLPLRIVEAILSTGTVALIGAIGVALFTPGVGLLAAAVATIHPIFAVMPVTQYVENLAAFLSVVGFGAFAWAMRRPSFTRWALTGAAFGLMTLCKPTAVAYLPGLAAGALLVFSRRGGRPLRWAVVFVLAWGLTLAPWEIRNHRVHHGWYLVAEGSGVALWRGNNPAATGASDFTPHIPPEIETAIQGKEVVEQEQVFANAGMTWIRAHPGRAVQLYFIKLSNLWALYPRTQTVTPYRNRAADLVQGLASVFIFVGALLGVRRAWRMGLASWILAIVSFSLMSAVAVMVLRYRMSFESVLIWLAALGWASLVDREAAAVGDRFVQP